MTEQISKIAEQLAGNSDEPDRLVPCAWCSAKTPCPGFIIAAVKTWNEQEKAMAVENNRRAQFINGGELGCCCPGDCTAKFRALKLEESAVANWTATVYLRDLRAGRYTPVTLQYLRERGHGALVTKILNEEGNRSHG